MTSRSELTHLRRVLDAGQIVYNPDGRAYILEEEGLLQQVPRQEGSFVDKPPQPQVGSLYPGGGVAPAGPQAGGQLRRQATSAPGREPLSWRGGLLQQVPRQEGSFVDKPPQPQVSAHILEEGLLQQVPRQEGSFVDWPPQPQVGNTAYEKLPQHKVNAFPKGFQVRYQATLC
jgi:hypothetical protein